MNRAIAKAGILLFVLSSITVVSTTTSSANTQENIRLGKIAYAGNACPKGSVSASLNPKSATLQINFNKYIVETQGRNQHSLRKKCNITVPLSVPKGMSVSLVSAHYKGKVSLPAGSQARIMNTFSFSGRSRSRFRTDLRGPNHHNYHFHDSLSSLAGVWSACGKNTTLRITTSIRIKTNGNAGKAHADSLQGLLTQLRYRSCQ